MRRIALGALLMAGCPGPFWGKICLGGTTTQSDACIVMDGSYIAVVGGVAGAHALNHDAYDTIKDAPGAIAKAFSSAEDAGPTDGGIDGGADAGPAATDAGLDGG
jgi:hypothetical protein